jgi:predicted DNA-binding transcriptional regulator YafY
MAGNAQQKLKLLYLLQILTNETDEEHPMKTEDVLRRLSDMGISAERKSIYRDINCLIEAGFDVAKSPHGGYFLGVRDFELSEVKLLIDAVQASRFITYKKSCELIGKLKGLVSPFQAESIDRQLHMLGVQKTTNERIYYNIDAVYTAIAKDKQITFRYIDYVLGGEKHYRSGGDIYSVSPYALIWDDEHYYLAAYYEKRGKTVNFRVDKIDSVEVTELPRLMRNEYKHFDPVEHAKIQFSMFGGEEQWVTVSIEDSLIGVFVDRFGSDMSLSADGEERSIVRFKAAISPTFMSWLFQFGARVTVLLPEKLRGDMVKMLNEISAVYGDVK